MARSTLGTQQAGAEVSGGHWGHGEGNAGDLAESQKRGDVSTGGKGGEPLRAGDHSLGTWV